MAKMKVETILLIAIGGFVGYEFLLKPKLTGSVIVPPSTPITAAQYNSSSIPVVSTAASALSTGTSLLTSLKSLFSPGSAAAANTIPALTPSQIQTQPASLDLVDEGDPTITTQSLAPVIQVPNVDLSNTASPTIDPSSLDWSTIPNIDGSSPDPSALGSVNGKQDLKSFFDSKRKASVMVRGRNGKRMIISKGMVNAKGVGVPVSETTLNKLLVRVSG